MISPERIKEIEKMRFDLIDQLLAERKQLVAIAEAAEQLGHHIQSLPWHKKSETDDTCCIDKVSWDVFNYRYCGDFYDAIEAWTKPDDNPIPDPDHKT